MRCAALVAQRMGGWRRYLVHMVQLDAAAMNLKRRFEDPTIAAQMEAQQAYTRALAPAGVSSRCYDTNHGAHIHSRQQRLGLCMPAETLHCPGR